MPPKKKTRRDDFKKPTCDLLCKRAGSHCSNPDCRKGTSGPTKKGGKAINIGVGAHICAAAAGGPRYDSTMTSEERKSIDNGIWLCQNCAALIDRDVDKFPAGLLEEWKRLAEATAELALSSAMGLDKESSDLEMLRFFSMCLDRPAFYDRFHREGSIEDFDQAIKDTITAISTGCLMDRKGTVLNRSSGKAFLRRHAWRRDMDTIVDMLRSIRARYRRAIEAGEVVRHGQPSGGMFYAIAPGAHDLGRWMDENRQAVLKLFSKVCEEATLPAPRGIDANTLY